jgi:redox-sensitive bicupin YhaK (pirin superfamily)
MTTFEMVPAGSLFTSEPDPRMFGNAANTPSSKTWTNANWLKSRFHFSFAEYHDSNRSNFGAMRVMNDDLVQPSRGFGTHGHRDAEICTYIVKGSLTHADSMVRSATPLM